MRYFLFVTHLYAFFAAMREIFILFWHDVCFCKHITAFNFVLMALMPKSYIIFSEVFLWKRNNNGAAASVT